jgi:hypothetical protein
VAWWTLRELQRGLECLECLECSYCPSDVNRNVALIGSLELDALVLYEFELGLALYLDLALG